MVQSRIQDYGSPVVAKSLKTMTHSLVGPSVLSGMVFAVDAPNRMRVGPGTAVTNQGVIVIETEAKTIVIPTGSNPVNYTVYYQHVDEDVSGGVSAALTLGLGLLTPEVVQGVILGYVVYPGGAAPLSTEYFVQIPPLAIGRAAPNKYDIPWTIPIAGHGFIRTAVSGQALTYGDSFDLTPTVSMYTYIRNNGTAIGNATYTFPFKVGQLPFAMLQTNVSIDINATLQPIFIDSAGSSFVLGSPLTGAPSIALKEISLPPSAVQHPNSLVYIQFMLSLAVGKIIKIQGLGLNPYNSPV